MKLMLKNILFLENDQKPVIRVDANETKEWWLNGHLHREDGPAVEFPNGSKEWWLNGRLHREDGPAVEYANGFKEWWLDGERHREDGPAVEHADGSKDWYLNGRLHREDGPAIAKADGSKEWWINGRLHREDGPAVESANGFKEWWINGKKFTEKEFKMVNLPFEDRLDVLSSEKIKIYNLFKQDVQKLVENLPEKEFYKIGFLRKILNLNSQPKEIQDLFNSLADKQGIISREKINSLENYLNSKEYGISRSKYEPNVQTLMRTDHETEVLQLNLSRELYQELKKDPETLNFFQKLSQISYQSNHPVIQDVTLAWMRYTDLGNIIIIEEIQTDLFTPFRQKSFMDEMVQREISKEIQNNPNKQQINHNEIDKKIREKYKKIQKNLVSLIGDWGKALILTLKHLALSQKIDYIFMQSAPIKSRTAGLKGEEKLNEIYMNLPAKMGFIKVEWSDIEKMGRGKFKDIADLIPTNDFLWFAHPLSIKESKKLSLLNVFWI